MDDKKKKKYVIPEAEIVDFANDDIVTVSGVGGTLYWGGEDDKEKPFQEGGYDNEKKKFIDFTSSFDGFSFLQ